MRTPKNLTRATVADFIRERFPTAIRFTFSATWERDDACWVWAGEIERDDGSIAEWSFDDHAPEDSLMVLG